MSFAFIGRTISKWNVLQPLRPLCMNNMALLSSDSSCNRLSKEKSPYLLQHATNPVNWYPWGEEAFQIAHDENKLIFLSVGYSTCHWCHVMERESFENEDIAKIMNEHFVNIKVDREERPDVDKLYMSFVTASSGRGGWPMSVFLMPDLVPIAGGTYFPPTDMYGRPGFVTMMKSLADKWRNDQGKFESSGKQIMEILKRNADVKFNSESEASFEETCAKCFAQISSSYEPHYGGFSQAPKFPQPSILNFLFAYQALNSGLDDAQSGIDMALHTLTMMARGGIHDHVSLGFARYSTDTKWHVPHFEKMLYDQSQLVSVYLDAYLATRNEFYGNVAKDIITYCMRDLSHPSGGFYSAEDADSYPSSTSKDKCEGAFCVWTHEEIRELLNEEIEGVSMADVFCQHYSVAKGGNVDPAQDPHNELENKNVLMAHGTDEETALEFGLEVEQLDKILKRSKKILHNYRQTRPRPHLDDKMVAAWNGMMLVACARAGSIMDVKEFVDRGEKLASFLKTHMWKDNRLLRAVYRGKDDEISAGSEIAGFCDDYAWVIQGLIRIYNITLNDKYLEWAEQLQDVQNELFWDVENGAFFSSKVDKCVLIRFKEDQDGVEPTVNSISSLNLVRLSRLLCRDDFTEKAAKIFKVFSTRLEHIPVALPEMIIGFMLYNSPVEQVILSGDIESEDMKKLVRAVHSSCLNPCRIVLVAGKDFESLMYKRHELLMKYKPKTKTAIAYVCTNYTCSLPTTNPDQLKEKFRLRQASARK